MHSLPYSDGLSLENSHSIFLVEGSEIVNKIELYLVLVVQPPKVLGKQKAHKFRASLGNSETLSQSKKLKLGAEAVTQGRALTRSKTYGMAEDAREKEKHKPGLFSLPVAGLSAFVHS